MRARLRGSKTPERIVFRDRLPHTETGKLLRRVVLGELTASHHAGTEQTVIDQIEEN